MTITVDLTTILLALCLVAIVLLALRLVWLTKNVARIDTEAFKAAVSGAEAKASAEVLSQAHTDLYHDVQDIKTQSMAIRLARRIDAVPAS